MIPPLVAQFIVDPFSGNKTLASESVTINVLPLPLPTPPSFTGAIGLYTMNVAVPSTNNVTESLSLELAITGSGNISNMSPPNIEETNNYRIVSSVKASQTTSPNTKVFDIVIIPKVSGDIVVSPIIFSYFSKDTQDYITLSSVTNNI